MCPLPPGRAAGGLVCPPSLPNCLPAPGSGYCVHRQLPPSGPGLVHNSGALTRPQQMGTDKAPPAGSDVTTLDT